MKNGRQSVTLADGTKVEFESGAHSKDTFAQDHLGPYFVNGTITPYPGADYYAVCYGELYAYTDKVGDNGHNVYIAMWSVGVPDCCHDVSDAPDYAGEWEPVKS